MEKAHQDIEKRIAEKGIRPTRQRLRVLAYLADIPCHPTVDQIYSALRQDMPDLSRTTVYNTLDVFLKAGLVRSLTISSHEACYEYALNQHSHFLCEHCGKIYDFNISITPITDHDLDGFQIHDKHVYFKGICPKCF